MDLAGVGCDSGSVIVNRILIIEPLACFAYAAGGVIGGVARPNSGSLCRMPGAKFAWL